MKNVNSGGAAAEYEAGYSSLKNFKKYGIFVGLLITIILLAIMLGILYQTKALFTQNVLAQTQNTAHGLDVLRNWIIRHQGVYVKKALARPNIPIKGVSEKISNPTVRTVDGETYVLKRFSHISKELSDISRGSNLGSKSAYHATSFQPINP